MNQKKVVSLSRNLYTMRTYYEAIYELKEAGLWIDCMAMFDRAWTLDFYFRLYQLVQQYEPEHKYGYAQRIVSDSMIISQMGGGDSYLEIEPHTVRMAVLKMEAECTIQPQKSKIKQ